MSLYLGLLPNMGVVLDEKPSQSIVTDSPTSTDQAKPLVGSSGANNSIQVHQILWQTLIAWIKSMFIKKS
jgi:hypothetical protein